MQQTLLLMRSFREGHYKHYPLQIQGKSPQPWVMARLWGLWPRQIQDTTSSVSSAVEALRKTQGLPPRATFVPVRPKRPGSHLRPPYSFSPQCQGKGKQRQTLPLPSSSCPCLRVSVCPLEQRQKTSSLFNLELWDRNSCKQQQTTKMPSIAPQDEAKSQNKWHVLRQNTKASACALRDRVSPPYQNSCT